MKDLGLRAKLARITGNNSGMAVVEVVLLIGCPHCVSCNLSDPGTCLG